jgi:hypothetical protein
LIDVWYVFKSAALSGDVLSPIAKLPELTRSTNSNHQSVAATTLAKVLEATKKRKLFPSHDLHIIHSSDSEESEDSSESESTSDSSSSSSGSSSSDDDSLSNSVIISLTYFFESNKTKEMLYIKRNLKEFAFVELNVLFVKLYYFY